VREGDGNVSGSEQCGAGQAVVHVGPGPGGDADPVQPQLLVLEHRRAATRGVEVDPARGHHRVGDRVDDCEVQGRRGLVHRLHVDGQQRPQHPVERVGRQYVGADADLPSGLVGASDLGGDADAQLRVPGDAQSAAEAGDSGGRGAAALPQLHDGGPGRPRGILKDHVRDLPQRSGEPG
jgi:hypothetical protein